MKNVTFITLLIPLLIEINSCTHERSNSVNPIQPGVVILKGHINKYNGDYKTGNLIFADAVTSIA